MLKTIGAFFLIMLIFVTGFLTFSYFATEEYGGHGILYTTFYSISAVK
ncbi:hypothetical protein V7166_00190 [Bacillus thuringiensis]